MSGNGADAGDDKNYDVAHSVVSLGPVSWRAEVADDGSFTLDVIDDGMTKSDYLFGRAKSRASFLERCEWHVQALVDSDDEELEPEAVLRRLGDVEKHLTLSTLADFLDNELASETHVAPWSQTYVLRSVVEVLLPLPEDALAAWWRLACARSDAHPVELAEAVAATYAQGMADEI